MTISNQNLNENNLNNERRNTNTNSNINENLILNNNINANNIINYNNSNQINSVNARENSLNEMSNLYFNIFSEMNNDNELAGRNFENDLDDIFQNLTYLINTERLIIFNIFPLK